MCCIRHSGTYNKTFVLTFIDFYSRLGSAILLKDKSSTSVLKGVKKIINNYGLPKKLITDEGKEFTSKIFNDYCRLNNIHHHTSSAYRHESNGRVERFNQTLLKIKMKEEGKIKNEF